nr:MAG TPA: hypothetical protein [Caudoviricetes sp.]
MLCYYRCYSLKVQERFIKGFLYGNCLQML